MILGKADISEILQELSNKGCLAYCLTTHYVSVDEIFLSIHGLEKEAVSIDKLLPHYEKESAATFKTTMRLVATEQSEKEVDLKLKKGQDIRMKMKYVSTSRGPGLYASFEDITAYKQNPDKALLQKNEALKAKLKDTNFDLKKAMEDLHRFSLIASHDLKTPLRIMVNFLNLIQRRLIKNGWEDAILDEYIEFVISSGKDMAGLLDNLLDYVRLDKAQLSNLDLNEVLKPIITKIMATYSEKEIIITSDTLPIGDFDQSHFQQLFHNLLDNSIKYNKNKSIQIHIAYSSKEDKHFFSIKDNGIGIAPEHHEKIFDLFKRLHNKGVYEGTGMGLAICKKIVSQYQGDIWMESKDGEGATMIFSLPKKLDQALLSNAS